jgi:hypothetical protein
MLYQPPTIPRFTFPSCGGYARDAFAICDKFKFDPRLFATPIYNDF